MYHHNFTSHFRSKARHVLLVMIPTSTFRHCSGRADIKFEFGFVGQVELILIDEALKPDFSCYWPLGPTQVRQAVFARLGHVTGLSKGPGWAWLNDG
jgi:hypothetical protein